MNSSKIIYRSFRNGDILGIVDIWNRTDRPEEHLDRSSYPTTLRKTPEARDFVNPMGLRQPINTTLFDVQVVSSPLFSRDLLWVAVDTSEVPVFEGGSLVRFEPRPSSEKGSRRGFDGRIVGFIHGGRGPNEDFSGEDPTSAVIAMLMVEERADQMEIAGGLLRVLEAQFKREGATEITAGAVYPNAPLYTGMLSGGESFGVLESDPMGPAILLENGYFWDMRYHLFRIPLAQFEEPTFFTAQTQKHFHVERVETTQPRNFWEMCALAHSCWKRFDLKSNEDDHVCGSVILRWSKLDPQDRHLLGMHNLFIQPEYRHHGCAVYRVSRALMGVPEDCANDYNRANLAVELQVAAKHTTALSLFSNLTFSHFATGAVFTKKLA